MAEMLSPALHYECQVAGATDRRLSHKDFATQLTSTFTLRAVPDVVVSAELVAVSSAPAVPGHEQFALVFRVPGDTPPVQRTFAVEHPVLGALQLFLVPVRSEPDGLYLHAVINRLVASAEGS